MKKLHNTIWRLTVLISGAALVLAACAPTATPAPTIQAATQAPTQAATQAATQASAPTGTAAATSGASSGGVSLSTIQGFTLNPTIAADVSSGKTLVFYVSYHDVSNDFAPQIKAGVVAAAKDLGVNATMVGPVGANAQDQISQLEDLIQKGVDGLAISSASTDALAPEINKALAEGIPVITFNTDNPSSNRLAFVGQDLFHSGEIAGDLMSKYLNGNGTVIITTLDAGAQWSIDREKGARQALAKSPGINIVQTLNTGTEPQGIYSNVENAMLAHPDVTGLLSLECCSVTPDGLYVQRNNLKGKVQVVGFDTNPSTLQLIKDGYIDASIYQDPYTQGYDAVKLLNDFVQGKTIQNVDTGAVIVDNTNVDQFLAQITTTPSTPPSTTVTPTP